MVQDSEMLQYIYQNAEMGRDGIHHIMSMAQEADFQKALQEQLNDYQSTLDTAQRMLTEKGVEPQSASPMAKASSYISSKMQTVMDPSPSHMAEMMIQGNTMGITKMTKRLHEYDGGNQNIVRLAQKQVEMEKKNIEQMKKFL